jgi:hypothetical protein
MKSAMPDHLRLFKESGVHFELAPEHLTYIVNGEYLYWAVGMGVWRKKDHSEQGHGARSLLAQIARQPFSNEGKG